jgi:hypothetical protein
MKEIPDLFHISENPLPSVLVPRTPEYQAKKDKTKFTETDIPRVSFSPSIYNCFIAIFPMISKYMESNEGLKRGIFFYVYKAVPTSRNKILSPEELSKKKLVWDAHVTQEYCFLDSIAIRYCGVVKIDYDPDPVWNDIYLYNDKREELLEKVMPPVEAIAIKQTLKLRGDKYRIRLYP